MDRAFPPQHLFIVPIGSLVQAITGKPPLTEDWQLNGYWCAARAGALRARTEHRARGRRRILVFIYCFAHAFGAFVSNLPSWGHRVAMRKDQYWVRRGRVPFCRRPADAPTRAAQAQTGVVRLAKSLRDLWYADSDPYVVRQRAALAFAAPRGFS
jgi:hypothetical protein